MAGTNFSEKRALRYGQLYISLRKCTTTHHKKCSFFLRCHCLYFCDCDTVKEEINAGKYLCDLKFFQYLRDFINAHLSIER